jgi:mannose-6-phosphate isomerase-like protein (cupin superfamily)
MKFGEQQQDPKARTLLSGSLELVICPIDEAAHVLGRRSFFEYLDFGVRASSSEMIGAQVVRTREAMVEPTGWHFHTLEAQMAYILEGWIEMQFEDGQVRRINANTFLLIPGGHRHREVRSSNPFAVLEIYIGEMATVPCEAPTF